MSAANKAVFLSYASQDADAARRICEALRAAGVEVWFDRSELRGGDAWDQKIRRQIKECALFLPIISANTQARREGYFRLEWKLADDRTHLMAQGTPFLLPVCIDETRDWDAIVPDSFTVVQWTRLPGGETTAGFCERVENLLGDDVAARAFPSAAEMKRPGAAAVPGKSRRWRAAALVALAVAVVALGIWQPWKRPASTAETQATAPLSEARQLTLQARALIDDDLMAVRENFRLADELCQKAVALDVTDGEAWATAARISAELVQRNYDASASRRAAAHSQAERAIRLAPRSVEAGLAEAANLVLTKNTAEAERRLRELLARAPGDPRVALVLASALGALGRAAEASEIRLRHPAFDRRDPRPLVDEATALGRRGQPAEAEALVNRAQDMAPSFKGYLTKLSLLLFGWGDLEAGERAIMNLPPGLLQEDVFAGVGAQLWLWLGRGDQAMMELQRVPQEFLEGGSELNFQPKGYLTGWAMQIAGRPGAAQAEWTQALLVVERRLAAEPNRPALLRWKALLQARTGQTDAAEKTWKLYSELSGQVNNPHGYIAMEFYVAMGRLEDAIAQLQGRNARSDARMYAIGLRYEPWFAPLRSDPRVQEMINEAVGWIAEERQRGAKPAATNPADAPAPPSVPAKSVAVLAFANLSADQDNEYFSDGISEELLTILQKIPGLRVAARTSAFSFKEKKGITAQDVGEKLGVAHVVEGSVQKSGRRVKITARLSRAATNEELWSQSFGPLELTDVFATQSEIAQAIVGELRGRLTGEAATAARAEIQAQVQAAQRGGTRNPEAHQLYLQALFFLNQHTAPSAIRASSLLRRTLELDPQFALGWAALSRAGWIRGWGESKEDIDEGAKLAREAADRAVELEPNLAAAHLARSDVLASHDFNWKAAAESLQRAVSLAPNDPAVITQAATLATAFGQAARGVDLYRQAVALDPVNPLLRIQFGYALSCTRRFDDAKAEFQRVIELSPTAPWGHGGVSLMLSAQGRFDQAAVEAEKETTTWSRLCAFAIARWGERQTSASDAALAELLQSHAEVAAVQIAWIYAFRGDNDRAFGWLDRSYRQHDGGLTWTRGNFLLEKLQVDPRWPAFLKKIGLADEQLK